MERQTIVLTFMTGSVLVGCLAGAVLPLGFLDWRPDALAVGFFLTWSAACAISRWITHDDPGSRRRGVACVTAPVNAGPIAPRPEAVGGHDARH